jgi:hypothetical protein
VIFRRIAIIELFFSLFKFIFGQTLIIFLCKGSKLVDLYLSFVYYILYIFCRMASCFIQIDKQFYFAGDTVQGHVFLNLFENINANEVIIKFKGWESVRWIE